MSRPTSIISCPYFIGTGVSHNNPVILCEGVIDGATERQKYQSNTDMKKYIRKHCAKAGQGCVLAEILEEKYQKIIRNGDKTI